MKYSSYMGFSLKRGTKTPACKWRNPDNHKPLHRIRTENKGIPCGLYPNALLVVDCDTKRGNGILEFEKMGIDHDTLTIITPSGGVHYYYTIEEQLPTVRVGNIDFQCDKTFVVACGSETEQGRYELLVNKPVKPAPPELVEFLKAHNDVVEGEYTSVSSALERFANMIKYDLPRMQPHWINSWVDNLRTITQMEPSDLHRACALIYTADKGEKPEYEQVRCRKHASKWRTPLDSFLIDLLTVRLKDGDGRNVALARQCGRMLKSGCDYDTLVHIMRIYVRICFVDPMEEEEFLTTINSMWRKEHRA